MGKRGEKKHCWDELTFKRLFFFFKVVEEFEALAVKVAQQYLYSGFIALSVGYLLHMWHICSKEQLANNAQLHTETI